MNPHRFRAMFEGDVFRKKDFLQLLSRVKRVDVMPIPSGEHGLLHGFGRDWLGRYEGWYIQINQDQDLEEQLITLVHELIHIPECIFGSPPIDEGYTELKAVEFVKSHRGFVEQHFFRRITFA